MLGLIIHREFVLNMPKKRTKSQKVGEIGENIFNYYDDKYYDDKYYDTKYHDTYYNDTRYYERGSGKTDDEKGRHYGDSKYSDSAC